MLLHIAGGVSNVLSSYVCLHLFVCLSESLVAMDFSASSKKQKESTNHERTTTNPKVSTTVGHEKVFVRTLKNLSLFIRFVTLFLVRNMCTVGEILTSLTWRRGRKMDFLLFMRKLIFTTFSMFDKGVRSI